MNVYSKTDDLTWVVGGMHAGNMDRCLFAPTTPAGGVEHQNNSLRDMMTGYHRDMQQDIRIAGGFVQNEWRLDRWAVFMGARLDKHNLTDHPVFSPYVSFLYEPSDNLQARLTYSTGFRASQAYDEDLYMTAVGDEGMQTRPVEGLREERSNNLSGSADWSLPMGHQQSNILLEGFYTDLHHVFMFEDIGLDENGDKIKERRNGSGAKVYSVSLDAKVVHGCETQLQLGFTVQRSKYNRVEIWISKEEGEQTTERMLRTSDYHGYFTFTSAPLKSFDFSLSDTYIDRMIVPHMVEYIEKSRIEHTPQFVGLNLKLNYTFVLKDHIKMQVNGGMQNIFNSFQKDLDKGEFRDVSYFYGPTQSRTYFMGIKIMNQIPGSPQSLIEFYREEIGRILQGSVYFMVNPFLPIRYSSKCFYSYLRDVAFELKKRRL